MIRNRHNLYVSVPNWFTVTEHQNSSNLPDSKTIVLSGQITESTDEKLLLELSLNLYNKSLIRQAKLTSADLKFDGYAVSVSEETIGQFVKNDGWSSTGFIEIVSGSTLDITASYDSSQKYGIVFYDLGKKVVSVALATGVSQVLTVPVTARYIRVCSKKNDNIFEATYLKPSAYSAELLTTIYDGNLDPFTSLTLSFQETISQYTTPMNGLSLVVDDPLKIEIDTAGNLHLNINGLYSGMGNYVTTTGEPQDVLGVKTFERGIGIGDYLIVPDIENESLKVIHKDSSKLGNLYTTGWLSAMGVSQNEPSSSNAVALYQLNDVLSDENSVYGAKEGSILRYNGTHWYGDEDEGLDLIKLQDYLDDHKYLTLESADVLFLTPEEGDELFLTQEEGDARYLLKTVFSKIFTAYDSSGNEVDITNYDTNIDNIAINYSLWSKGFVSAYGKQEGDSQGDAVALYQLTDVLSNETNTAVLAEKGQVLTYDGTHWYGTSIDTNVMEEIDVDNQTISKAGGYLHVINQLNITIDNSLSETSTNPVLNKVINEAINNIIQVVSSEDEAINGNKGVLYVLL